MRTIIFSISALLGLGIQVNAQIGASPTPSLPAAPQVQAYSSTTTGATYGKQVANEKAGYDTETYSASVKQQDQYDDPQKTKSFSKSYALGRGDKVNVSNVYGNIIVKTWEKNEVKLDADIRAFANSEDEAQKLIDNVNVTSSKSDDEVMFKTHMDDRNGGGSGSRNGKRWRREVKIFMTLYLPANAALTATMQYGNLELPDFYGPTALKVQYGKLITGDLKNVNNFISAQYTSVDLKDINKATIKQQYGSGLTIASIGDLNLNAQYATVRIGNIRGNANIKQQYGSGLSISSVDNLDLDAQYASVKIGTVRGDAGIKMQYGDRLNIDQVGNLSLTSQYVAVRVGKLTGNFIAKSQYGGRLTVEHVVASSKLLNLDTEYITVSLAFAANYGGNFNVNLNNSSLKAGENVNARRVGDDDDRRYSSSKEYSGTVGRGGSASIKINASYGGSVTLTGI